VFSDESIFLLYRQDGRVRVRRQSHEALLDECVLPRVQAGGRVTIWGVFHSRGKSELDVLDRNMDQYQYIRDLETKTFPFAKIDFQANCVFQDKNVQDMDWPAMSPDLNPIENLWLKISHGLNKMDNPPTSVSELAQAVVDIWRDIPD